MIARETIYAALFARVAAAGDFVTIGRRLRSASDVAPVEQPALFMCQRRETAATPVFGAPTVWTLAVELYLYAHSSDPYQSPATVLNPLLDAVEAALAPAAGTGVQDLGLPGMVQHAAITGKVKIDEATAGDQATAVVPIEILCV